MNNNPIIAVTPGEPAGIGPDITIQMAQQKHDARLIAIADPSLLTDRAKQLNLPLTLHECEHGKPMPCLPPGELYVSPIELNTDCTPGELNPANADYVLRTLTAATQGCIDKCFNAIVTGPVHKGVINESGINFSGHTEFLADYTHTDKVVMMLATEGLRVALATTHLPLSRVANAITPDLLEKVIRILHNDMTSKFGIKHPHILICGLNPHAGEGGHMGREEIDTIEPVIKKLQHEGMQLQGPLPADTLFTPKYLEQADAVLAMFHDQGLPVLKYLGFGKAVNITLGLPIIRTSVDHGTALSLAGLGTANTGSLKVAIDNAIEMANHHIT